MQIRRVFFFGGGRVEGSQRTRTAAVWLLMFLFAVILRSLACWSGTSVEAVDAASLGYRLLIAKYSPMIQ